MKLLIVAAALLFAFAAPAAAQYQEAGTIVVTPPNPIAGSTVTVAVTGCEPFGGQVTVRIDGVNVGTANVAADGSFTGDFVVPEEAQGPVTVEALCTNEVLGSVITVRVGELPFQDPELPRTGTNTTMPLARMGLGLFGAGAILLVAAGRKRNEYQAVHAGAKHA